MFGRALLSRYCLSSTSSDSTASSKTNAHAADAAAAASTATEPARACGRDKEYTETTFMFAKVIVARALKWEELVSDRLPRSFPDLQMLAELQNEASLLVAGDADDGQTKREKFWLGVGSLQVGSLLDTISIIESISSTRFEFNLFIEALSLTYVGRALWIAHVQSHTLAS